MLLQYTPDEALVAATHWAAIQDFTLRAVSDAARLMAYEERMVVAKVAQFVDWQWTRGQDLDRSEIFQPAHVERFIRQETKHMVGASRGNYRSILRRVCEALEPPEAAGRPMSLASASPAAPYTAAEEAALEALARNQSTEHRRENLEVLLALCLGAGMATEDLALLLTGQVVKVSEGVEIHIAGRRPRIVPVMPRWEAVLLGAVERVGDGRIFLPARDGHTHNLVSNFVCSLQLGKAPRPNTQRMRVTWIVRLLNAGIKLNVIMALAGVTEAYAITRYAGFMDEVPLANAHAAVRALGRHSGGHAA